MSNEEKIMETMKTYEKCIEITKLEIKKCLDMNAYDELAELVIELKVYSLFNSELEDILRED